MFVHLLSYAVVVAFKKVKVAVETAEEAQEFLPRELQSGVSEVIHKIAGAHHGIVIVRDPVVHLVKAGERAALPQLEDVPMPDMVISSKPDHAAPPGADVSYS